MLQFFLIVTGHGLSFRSEMSHKVYYDLWMFWGNASLPDPSENSCENECRDWDGIWDWLENVNCSPMLSVFKRDTMLLSALLYNKIACNFSTLKHGLVSTEQTSFLYEPISSHCFLLVHEHNNNGDYSLTNFIWIISFSPRCFLPCVWIHGSWSDGAPGIWLGSFWWKPYKILHETVDGRFGLLP